MDFVKTFRFERLGVFAYSEEDGTPAALMDEQVPLEVREARRDEIMSLQQDIAEVRLSRFTDCDSSFSFFPLVHMSVVVMRGVLVLL